MTQPNYSTSFTVFPDHTNYNDPPSIFGGKMLAEMDNCAAMTCRRALYGTEMTDAITVAVEKVSFFRPAFIGEIVHLHGILVDSGSKSLTVTVVCEREDKKGERVKMAQGTFVFVSRKKGVVIPHGLNEKLTLKSLVPGGTYTLKNGEEVEFSRISGDGKGAVCHPPGEPDMQSCFIVGIKEFKQ